MPNATSPDVERALFGGLIKPIDLNQEFEEQQKHIRQLLFRYLNTKTVVALVGSGCSVALGYPNWANFAKDVLQELEKSSAYSEAGREAFNRFKGYLDDPAGKLPDYVTYRTIFSECERYCERQAFRKLTQEYFLGKHREAKAKRNQGGDCYKPLIDLKIRRFVTTNYDLELEMALMREGKITDAQLFGKDCDLKALENPAPGQPLPPYPNGKSFTQRYECREQLSRFSLARHESSDYMVFHCHGRIDDIDSCVITEEDYRHWYLRDVEEVKARQQTMDVLLGSNPLLVVGYSMGDPEFMHLLQFIHANRINDPNRSPLFVLLYIPPPDSGKERMSEKMLGDICVSLHARYGAHVIPVLGGEETVPQKFAELKAGWVEWWKSIQAKPLVKTFSPQQGKPYFHYRSKQLDEETFIKTAGYEDLKEELTNLILDPTCKRFAVLTGPAGTGKTWGTQWFAIQFAEGRLSRPLPLDSNVYFWSSYYTNDLFTGIKRALKFFDYNPKEDPIRPENLLDKFKRLLDEKEALIIFDGIERLLQPVDNVADGRAVNQDVTRFFEIIREGKAAFVILTSRQWPVDILCAKASDYSLWKNRLHLRAPRCLSTDLQERSGTVWGKRHMTDEARTSFCSLLEGHIYCLSLIEKMLGGREDGHLERFIDELLHDIVSTPSDRRPERVIRTAIEEASRSFDGERAASADARPRRGNLLLKFLERVALFMNPIEKQVVKLCLALAEKELNTGGGRDEAVKKICLTMPRAEVEGEFGPGDEYVESVIEHLVERSLLLEVEFNDATNVGYTVHPLLQKYVRKRLHHSVFSSHPSMILPGYTSAFEVVDPGSHAVGLKVSRGLFEELCRKAESASGEDKGEAALYCRSAFGVLRSRFCANTVSRWGNYQEYIQMVYRLYDTARLASARVWSHAEYETKGETINQTVSPTGPPLYIDELAWLFNELGFSAFSIGNMLDAMVIWQQGLEVNALVDGARNGVYRFQSYFNLGVGFIHLGNLHHARTYLDRAIQIAYEMDDPMLRGRVLGYIALLKYLQGNLDDADHDFKAACVLLKGNARGLSVFLTHHSELLLKKGDLEGAQQKIDNSRSLAEGAYFPDLVAYATLAEANLLRQQKKYTEAQNKYSAALKASMKIGLRRLEAAALSGLSRWAYDLNDSEIARQKAFAALKVANETSLGLHQTLAMLTLGKALLLANQRELGGAYLKSAQLMAKEQGYFLRAAEAEAELQLISE